MIRFLQKDSRLIKIIFAVIIVVAVVTMVITLVPGIFYDDATTGDTYATVHGGGLLGRFSGSSIVITMPQVQQVAERMLQEQHLPDMMLPYLLPRAGEALIQREVLVQEASRLGLDLSDADLRIALQTGPFAPALFPNGQFIGEDRYADFVENYYHVSVQDFESQIKKELEVDRLESMVTGGATVSEKEVRDAYIRQGTKIKFDYAVLNADDLRKQINPTDAELQTFFKQNASRYANAVPEMRKLSYFQIAADQIPGGAPRPTDAEIQSYYQQHLSDYQVPEEVTVRHILIAVPAGADAATDQAAKQKAEALLKQIRSGADFAELAKKNSDDPGSKDNGGELGPIQRGVTVPAFESAAFALQPGQVSDVVKTQFGYHIIKVEAKQTAHTKPLDEVKQAIVTTLTQQAEGHEEEAYAQQLAAEAAKTGMAKTAEAHRLKLVQTDYLPQNGQAPGLADSSKLLSAAFAAQPGAAPQAVSAGGAWAVFQVQASQPAHAPSFEEYKAHLLDDFREQQLPQLLARKTSELADKARAENSLAQAAKELGATLKTSDLLGRNAQAPDIGDLASVAPGIFDLKPGEIGKPIDTARSGIVVKIDQVQQPDAQEVARHLEQTRSQLIADRREQMFSVFVDDLTRRYEQEGRIHMNPHPQSPTPSQPS